MKVIVLGAGVIGVTSAYFLALAGHEVTVLEKNSKPGMGCSHANGGQLSYSHVETWAQKASIFSVLKELLSRKSFLSGASLWDKELLPWAWKFYRNSGKKVAQKNSKNLFKIASLSKDVLGAMMEREKTLKFDHSQTGTIHFFKNKKKFGKALHDLDFLTKIGCKSEILTAEDCIKKEPTLVKLFDEHKLAGGIFHEMDGSGNSFSYIKSLAKICSEKYGVKFEYDVEVENILTNHKKITGIKSDKGVFAGDSYVYAMGAYGCKILKGIGVKTSIYPLKGCSLSINASEEFVAPKITLTDPENKIVYSRIGNIFRAAGTVELGGFAAKDNRRNIKFLEKVITASFSDYGHFENVKEWSGFRPFRPSSIPLICKVKKYGNLFLNAGHGSLGWTLSAGSGQILADLLDGKEDGAFKFLKKEKY